MAAQARTPKQTAYDVVIIGGAIMGSSAAWFLTDNPDFDGSILVIERDMSYATASTTHTNSCMRQQFSEALNIEISQFAADFVKNLRHYMGGDARVPDLSIRNFGYLYLADSAAFADVLRENHKVQRAAGAATELLSPHDIQARYPFYNVQDIVLGAINTVDEGYFDAHALFDWWRRQARERGVDYIENEVVAITQNARGTAVEHVTLKSGEVISCGHVVNAAGPRAGQVAALAGLSIPVEPRKRFSWIFSAQTPLERALPLTIAPSGVYVRENGGGTYHCGGHAAYDPAVAFDDFALDHALWENHIWPVLATRIPQFEAIKVQAEWAGHYAMNTFDHNAIVGPHTEVGNFIFLNGFSGHGVQQAPAMGRGTAEWITYQEYRALDLSPFAYARLPAGQAILEKAVI